MTSTQNTTTERDWRKEPVNWFDAPPEARRLYTQAYNELAKVHPNIVLPESLIRERMQEIVNRRPRVWVVSRTGYNTRFRAVGEPTAPDWIKSRRPANEPWCEFTIWRNDNRLSSFGGEVWPSAWPELFSVGPRTIYGQTTTLTEVGESIIREAIEQYEAREADMEPDFDDSVKACPECETPNQFGEVCARCRREIQDEGRTDLEVD